MIHFIETLHSSDWAIFTGMSSPRSRRHPQVFVGFLSSVLRRLRVKGLDA
jgi:hypothetical protein